MTNPVPPSFRSGFVGIIGAPNVGKSTLLNHILGEKVAITSDKPQTTRHRILGVMTTSEAQIIFLDTPGVHRSDKLLNRELVAAALGVLSDADVILFMTEPERRTADEAVALEAIAAAGRPVVAVVNKIDRIGKPDLLPVMAEYNERLQPKAIVPICALNGEGVPDLLAELTALLPEGPQYYPPDTLTDQMERFIAGEMIREQVFRLTSREIPYSTAVTVEEFKEEDRGAKGPLVRIKATIHVERDSQKGIVIGRGGSMLKEIGAAARSEVERLTGAQVFLELFVRVSKNWSKNPRALQEFGYKQ